jgi:hypothetical protein
VGDRGHDVDAALYYGIDGCGSDNVSAYRQVPAKSVVESSFLLFLQPDAGVYLGQLLLQQLNIEQVGTHPHRFRAHPILIAENFPDYRLVVPLHGQLERLQQVLAGHAGAQAGYIGEHKRKAFSLGMRLPSYRSQELHLLEIVYVYRPCPSRHRLKRHAVTPPPKRILKERLRPGRRKLGCMSLVFAR